MLGGAAQHGFITDLHATGSRYLLTSNYVEVRARRQIAGNNNMTPVERDTNMFRLYARKLKTFGKSVTRIST